MEYVLAWCMIGIVVLMYDSVASRDSWFSATMDEWAAAGILTIVAWPLVLYMYYLEAKQ